MHAASRRKCAIEAAFGAWARMLPTAVIQLVDFLAAVLVLFFFFRTDDDLSGYLGVGCLGFAMLAIQACAWSKIDSLLQTRVNDDEDAIVFCMEKVRATAGFAALAPSHLHGFWAAQLYAAALAEMAAMSAHLDFARKKHAWMETATRQREALDRYDEVKKQTTAERTYIADERWYLLYEKIEYRVKKHILEQRMQHLRRIHSFQRTEAIIQDRVDHVKARLSAMQLHEQANVQGTLRRFKEKHDRAKWNMQKVTIERRKANQEAKLNNITVTAPEYLHLQSNSVSMSRVLTWSKALQGSLQSLPLALLTAAKLSSQSDSMDAADVDLLFACLVIFSISMAFGFFGVLVAGRASSAPAIKCHPIAIFCFLANIAWALFAMGLCFSTPDLGVLSYLLPLANLLHGPLLAGLFVALKAIRGPKTITSNQSTDSSFDRLRSLPDDKALSETAVDDNFLRSMFLGGLCTALASAVTDVLSFVSKEHRALHDAYGSLELMSLLLPVLRRVLLLGMAVAGLVASYSRARVAWVVGLCCTDLVAGAFLVFPQRFAFRPEEEDHGDEASEPEDASAAAPEPEEEEASVSHQGVEISEAPEDADYVHSQSTKTLGGTGVILEIAAEGLNEIMKSRHHWRHGIHHHHRQHHPHGPGPHFASHRGIRDHAAAAKESPKKKKKRQVTRGSRYIAKEYSQLFPGAVAGPCSSVALPQPPPAGSVQASASWQQQLLSLCSPECDLEHDLPAHTPDVPALEPLVRPERSAARSAREVRAYVSAQRLLRVASDCVEAVSLHANAALARSRGSSVGTPGDASREEPLAIPPAPALLEALEQLQQKAVDLAGAEIARQDVITLQRGIQEYTPSANVALVGDAGAGGEGKAERKLLDALSGKREEGSDERAAAQKMKVAGPEIMRATTLQYALRPGAWASVPTVFGPTPLHGFSWLSSSDAASSFEVATCGCFVSHSWSESQYNSQRKPRVIFELFVLQPFLSTSLSLFPLLAAVLLALSFALEAALRSDAVWVLPFLRGLYGSLKRDNESYAMADDKVVPIGALACLLLWLLFSSLRCLPHRLSLSTRSSKSLWLDSVSVDYHGDKTARQRIAGFKAALHTSESFLALVSPTYVRRLWPVFELAVAAKTKPHDLLLISLEWPSVFSPWLSAQVTDAERSWFADFTCRDAQTFAPKDRIAVCEAIRHAFGTEAAFDLFVREELPAVLRRSKLQYARRVRAAFRDALASVLGA